MMIDPPRPGPGSLRLRDHVAGQLLADGHALDAQALAPAVVGLDQDAHRAAAVGLLQHPGRGADAALEAVADHARAAADVALPDRSRRGRVDRLDHVLGAHVHAVDVVQGPVPGLPHHRQAPGLLGAGPAGQPGRDQGVAHHPDAVGVGDRDRRGEQARLADPLQAGQLPVAVQPVAAGERRLGVRVVRGGEQHRHPGAHGVAPDQGGVAHPDPGHVGDRVVRPWPAGADGDAQVPCPHGPSIPGRGGAPATRPGTDWMGTTERRERTWTCRSSPPRRGTR